MTLRFSLRADQHLGSSKVVHHVLKNKLKKEERAGLLDSLAEEQDNNSYSPDPRSFHATMLSTEPNLTSRYTPEGSAAEHTPEQDERYAWKKKLLINIEAVRSYKPRYLLDYSLRAPASTRLVGCFIGHKL